MIDRFTGRILGAGSTSGLRLVIGDWASSPWGAFTDVMVATAAGRRLLLAPTAEVADYVASTYTFDEVAVVPVELAVQGNRWRLAAGDLACELRIGGRTAAGRLLHAVPDAIERSRAFAAIADPVARRIFPGVRTRGSAGGGRREYYGAHDQHRVTALSGSWRGRPLGELAPVDPAPRFGFSSTPVEPCLTRVTTTIVRGGGG
ncbi:hypothetical protein CGZ94_21100 [Enemella evansiae]|uniref:Uncharacterized protein n=1 Tax=Enemella evansiae TaxID=2016499 RepID=A0A255G1A8_9ACTN|nr:hypothetical protein [Enemella evansiae]OYO07953.1 hypothetical protein CGZ94_21100 [Enemella evansiae]OYO14924.1 hypothetical protein CGZ98_00210 [Enemella evansiae]